MAQFSTILELRQWLGWRDFLWEAERSSLGGPVAFQFPDVNSVS
jgi:hypothetical protein